MDSFFIETTEDLMHEIDDSSPFYESECEYESMINELKVLQEGKIEGAAEVDDKGNKTGKKVSFEKIKADNLKLKEKFEGLRRFFEKAGKEDVKETPEEEFADKVIIRKEAIKAMKEFNKFDKEILGYINRMTDCIYDRDITKEDFLKMSDRQYRDLRQRIEYDTEAIRELKYASGRDKSANSISISKQMAYKYSLDMDRKYEDIMRKLSREVEETYKRKLRFEILTGVFAATIGVATGGLALIPYYIFFRNYWFKGWRCCTQIYKFRRNYKERYNLIKLLLKG